MARFSGKTVIVTGAARGQGAAEAALFRAEGANVVATDIFAGGGILVHDIADEVSWQRVVDNALTRFGRVDVLVNNAGVLSTKPFEATEPIEFDRVMRVNQRGTFLGMRAVMGPMREVGGGAIVITSSGAALTGTPGMFAYVASKWALRGMSKAAARDLAQYKIRVNAILPGIIDTAMAAENPPESLALFKSLIPFGRFGTPDEIAQLVAFLASDEARYITGAEFAIDGGLNA
ncbi:MAG TPA: SDR family NAD(P)-dependent oxidoreductase [Stellaceae bacterium]|nr:SDR family NAD(P)-dependent oxidoreductase [Stellaceae bacterium]